MPGAGKKWIKYLVAAALAYWVLSDPLEAASAVRRAIAGLTGGAEALSTFVSAL